MVLPPSVARDHTYIGRDTLMRQVLRFMVQKIRSLRALVKDEDHDSWYDDHRGDRGKPPNVGPNLGGGGT